MARRLIVLLLLVTACAEAAPPTLASSSVEAALPASIWPDEPSLVSVVACPRLDTEIIAQATTCTATLDTNRVTVDVEVDDAGAASATVREPLFVVSEASEQLARRLADDLDIEQPTVACRQQVVVAAAGVQFFMRRVAGWRHNRFRSPPNRFRGRPGSHRRMKFRQVLRLRRWTRRPTMLTV